MHRYHLTVATVLRDPNGEPVRLGSVTYLVTQPELSASEWPMANAYPLECYPIHHDLPPIGGKPSGQILTHVSLTLVPDREVNVVTEREGAPDGTAGV